MGLRIIKPPKFLHDIHGSTTTLFDVILTYIGGILSVLSIYILYLQNNIDIPVWKLVLLLLISADIGAGVIANFTKGTNSYYGGEGKSKSRLVFILSHFFHATIFLYTLNLFSLKTISLVCFVIVSTFIINSIRNKESQKVIASFCIVFGIGTLLILEISNPLLLWFFPLYMTKLFIAFGIRRY
ncbi:hypothetical protein [Cyclobacterium plantarum]|uniref:Uncharacterized protein n=1 Tax=Cyclobacterium plantarum TaxID=2716263 RepID=A0ABX0H2C5_9BACT|nr:hypothetical protein [Cyclobacterium plantarum]NHE55941.1 hypothetical protein [Cyclobacterium plantarum]|tara:strand:+ start:651 stop:1202 length:552 start_codon:yes stop_codon:yes gene_type:complete